METAATRHANKIGVKRRSPSYAYGLRPQGVNFLRTIARLATERNELRVVADQFGSPTTARAIGNAVANMLPSALSDRKDFFLQNSGVANLACAGVTTWRGFAEAIVTGLKRRGMKLVVQTVAPIGAADFPVKAKRPNNSRLNLSRLTKQFGIKMPDWRDALERELDVFVGLQNSR